MMHCRNSYSYSTGNYQLWQTVRECWSIKRVKVWYKPILAVSHNYTCGIHELLFKEQFS